MKKICFYVLLLCLFLPYVVSAKEHCKVVSGNGKEVGSEIACGEEHFYVVSSTNDSLKMLSKYNLLVGETIMKVEAPGYYPSSRTCSDMANSLGYGTRFDDFYNTPGYCFLTEISNKPIERTTIELPNDGTNNLQNVFNICSSYVDSLNENNEDENIHYSVKKAYYKMLDDYSLSQTIFNCNYQKEYLSVKQSETALSAHWDEENNYIYPQIGDLYINAATGSDYTRNYRQFGQDFVLIEESGTKYNNYFYDLDIGEYTASESVYDYYIFEYLPDFLNKYLVYLESLNFDIQEISLLTLDEINDIIKMEGSMIPYEEWYNHTRTIAPPHYEFGSIPELISNKHNFLYNTSYWIRTGYDRVISTSPYDYVNPIGVENIVFINKAGGVCGAGFTESREIVSSCYPYYKYESFIGTGLRPTITIPIGDLDYLIETDSNDGGEIEVINNSSPGENVTFRVKPKSGYKLASLVIKRANGEEIEISPDDLIENEDGTVTLLESFTMPTENVVIYARWVSIYDFNNPTTGSIFLLFILLMVSTGLVFLKRKKQRV